MKKIMLLLCLSAACFAGKAQTFDEWFKQKKTQIKYLGQQIVALQVYTGYLQKGYAIAKSGLGIVSDLKNGEFSLHKNYFGSLGAINPVIQKDEKIADIIALQLSIIQVYGRFKQQTQSSSLLTMDELSYTGKVFSNLLSSCAQNINQLITVTTASQLLMKDDERIKRIDALFVDMQEKYAFVQSFCNDANLLSANRLKEHSEAAVVKGYYNLPEN